MDNKQSFKVADKIATQLSKDKLLSGHLRVVRDIIQEEIKTLHVHKQEETTANMTDDELRQELRQHLISKLKDKSLSASEIAQLKDVFGLADQTSDLTITTVDYKNAIVDCPHCNANILQPSVVPI